MADIDILVDSSQVKTAKQELQELSNSFNSAFKSASVFTQAFRKAAAQSAADARVFRDIARANQDIINANLKVSNSYKSAEASAEAFTKGLREQEAQALRTARANQDAINKQLGVSGPTAMGGGAGFGALESEIERLRQKYDQMYSASKLYETSLAELNRAHMLGVTSTKQHEAALESLNLEYQNFQNGTAGIGNRFARNVQQNMAGVNNAGVLIQQLGYQVGDFIVQVQSGTNAFVAFGQQATQMAGFLPMVAQSMNIATVSVFGFNVAIAPLTLGLSVVIPLLTAAGAAFMRTSSDSDGAAKSIDRQAQAYNTLIDRVQELRLERQMEATGIASQEEQIVLNDLNKLLENRVILQDRLNQLQNAGGRAAGYAQAKQEQMDLLQADIDRNEAAIKAIQYERDLATAASRRANEQRNAYREAKAEADRWKASLEGIKSVLDSMNGMAVSVTLDLKSTASGWASQFLSQLTTGFENKRQYIEAVGGGRGLNMGGPEIDPYGFRDQLRRDQNNASIGGSSGGGGGGGGAGDARLNSLIESLQTEREVIEEWYAESQSILQTASDTELALIGGRNEAKLRLEQEYQERLKGIRDLGNQTALGQAETFFGEMASALQGGNEKMLKASRVFAAVEATINAYRAYSQTLADPSLPWWAKIPKALAVLSAGMSVVSAIKGGGSSVNASSGRGSATVASSGGAAPTPQTVYIDSLDPSAMYSGQSLIDLFEAFYNENDRRGKVFVVAR